MRVARKRREPRKISAPVADDARRIGRKLFVPHGKGLGDHGKIALLEQIVPLIENALVARERRAVLPRSLRNGEIEKAAPLIRAVLNEAELPGRKKDAVHVSHKVRRPRHLVSVDKEFALVLEDRRLQRHASEARLRARRNAGGRFAAADQLTVMPDPDAPVHR